MGLTRRPRVHYDLTDKVVVATGASGGIGAATVRALVAQGACVALVDLRQADVDAVAASLPPERVLALAADVTDAEAMVSVVTSIVARFGRLDVVFANAGIANDPPATMVTTPLARYERVIEVDLLGVVRTIKPALPEVIANRGHIVITGSVYSFMNGAANSAYASSKAAIEMLGRSLRTELAPHGATAGVLYPGWVATPITHATQDDPTIKELHAHAYRGRLGRFIEPEQIADAVVAGVRRRAPRIIEPGFWIPFSTLRGITNPMVDRWLESDSKLHELLLRLESERQGHPAAH